MTLTPLKQKEVAAEMTAWATEILNDPKAFPMGAEAERTFGDGDVILARVEHHTYQGKTGKHGSFRGVSLYRKSEECEPEPPGAA